MRRSHVREKKSLHEQGQCRRLVRLIPRCRDSAQVWENVAETIL